jgi:hypothetical protein
VNDTEQLIKEALGKLAERTPHPGPTLNALRRKHKRQRNNIFLIATAGVAAVAVLIFAGVIASDRYTPPTGNDAAAALVPGTGQGVVALKYSPHWLPEGFAETLRAANPDGTTARVWTTANAPQVDAPRIELDSGLDYRGGLAEWQDAAVRGLKARVQVSGTSAVVEWKAQDTLVVQVVGVTDPKETALRVADSVRADSNVTFQAPFRVKDKHANEFKGTSPGDWSARLSPAPVDVTVSSATPDFTGKKTSPVTVRGRQGVVLFDGRAVAVQEGGVWISATSTGDKSVEDLVAAINDVTMTPNVDTGWIGKK